MELRIILEGLEPPSGVGLVDDQVAWAFVGWLELIEQVERLRDGQDESGSSA